MGYGYFNHMGGGDWFGGVMMLAFWVVIILLVVWSVQGFSGRNKQQRTALDILKERYAKGEINKEEFETKKKDLIN